MVRTPLDTTPIGHTGLQMTRVRVGARAIDRGGWESGWGVDSSTTSARECVRVVVRLTAGQRVGGSGIDGAARS